MAVRHVVLIGDSILRKKCKPVTEFDEKLGTLIDDMAETLKAENGVGIAGPQVGVLKRVIVVMDGDKVYGLVNPIIVKQSGIQENVEGCLSVPGKYGVTRRPRKVTVKAFDRSGKEVTVTGTDMTARCFCHEIDHLEGVLFIDNVLRMVDPKDLVTAGKKKRK